MQNMRSVVFIYDGERASTDWSLTRGVCEGPKTRRGLIQRLASGRG